MALFAQLCPPAIVESSANPVCTRTGSFTTLPHLSHSAASITSVSNAALLLIGLWNLWDCYLLIDCSERSKVHYLKQENERDPEEQMDAWKYQKKD